MNIKRMDLAWIIASDTQKAKQFFGETLGLKISTDSSEHGWMEFVGHEGGATLGVGKECKTTAPDLAAGQNAVVTMTVDNIVAMKKSLEDKGVKFLGDIIEVPGHVKMAMFCDADNNKFQIVEMLSESK